MAYMSSVGAVLALLLLAPHTTPSTAQSAGAATVDAERLLAFKASLSNADTVLSSWVKGTDPCTRKWQGISCSTSGRVERMALIKLGLEGTIPAPRGWVLPELLTSLDLSLNKGLVGPLPSAWWLPAGLQELALEHIKLSSSLSPEWVAGLPAGLTHFSLKDCNVTGALPPALDLPKLWFCDLSLNQLTGTVPQWKLPSLCIFSLHSNKLTGSVPSDLTFDPSSPYCLMTLYNNDLSGPYHVLKLLDVSKAIGCLLAGITLISACSSKLHVWPNVYIQLSVSFAFHDAAGSLPPWPTVRNAQVAVKGGNPNLCGDLPTYPQYTEKEPPANLYNPIPQGSLPACPEVGEGSSPSGSSMAVIAGVAAAAVGGAVLAGLAGLAYWKRRRRRLRAEQLADPEPGSRDLDDPDALVPDVCGSPSSEEWSSIELPTEEALLDSTHDALQPEGSSSHSGGSDRQKSSSLGEAMVSQTMHFMTSHSLGVNVARYIIPWSQLVIKKQIGRGASSRVYLATWNKTSVAGKLLLVPDAPEFDISAAADNMLTLTNPVLGDLKTEANLMAALRHPNILGFFAVCLQPPAIVVEHCPRGSLYDVLKRARESPEFAEQLSWPLRLNIALGGARGFLYLHSRQPPVLHRDFKSPNLLLDANFNAKVADFNMSRIICESSLAFQHSLTVGNPRWLAPEVLDGGTHSFAADVFSFGIVLWELLTLQAPWEGEKNQWQVSCGIIKGQRPPIPEPDQLLGGTFEGLDSYVELVKSCWAPDPAGRPPFQEVVQRLRAIQVK